MKNIFYGTIIGIALSFGGAVFAGIDLTSQVKPTILKQNVELHSRLNEPMVWDTSVATANDISQAYVDEANALGVTSSDILKAGGNIQTAIQEKLSALGKMCKK